MRALPLLIALTLGSAATAQVPDALGGRWSGAAVYEGGALRLLDLEIEVAGPDSVAVVLTQPYNGFTRFGFPFAYEPGGPADGALVAGLFGDEMRLLVDLDDGTLRGTVRVGADTTATVSLQRVLDYPLPSFRVEEVSFTAGRDTLGGSLVLPEGAGPFATAVLVPGRGYGYGRGEMASWATLLVRNGIAAFIFDARGTGVSTGVDSLTTGRQRVEDVDAALDAVLVHPEVRPDAVGVVSNSAGSWVTPLAIADRDDVAFWVSLVGPAGSLAHQQAAAVREAMRRSDQPFTPADYAAATAYQEALVEAMGAGVPWDEIAPRVEAARTAPWAAFADLPDAPTDEQPAYFARRTGFDNTAALRTLRVPTLAIFGAEDVVVPPSEHVPQWRALAAEAGNGAFTAVVLPGVDHSLGIPPGPVGAGDWPAGYTRVWGRPGALFTTVVAWTRQRVGL